MQQAGDKTQAGSDQKLSGKSSDDDEYERGGLPASKPGSDTLKIGRPHAGAGALANGLVGPANGEAANAEGAQRSADGAFDRSKFTKLAKRPPAGPVGRKGARKGAAPAKDKPTKGEDKGKPGKARPARQLEEPACSTWQPGRPSSARHSCSYHGLDIVLCLVVLHCD